MITGGDRMYISYEKLWKTLIDKHLQKTDLISLCGISSRTLTKLSKNENVNTDTLLRICESLDCDLNDIMEIHREKEAKNIFEAFCLGKKKISEDEYKTVYEFSYGGKRVNLTKTKLRADKKHTVIHCKTSSILWEKQTPVGTHVEREYCEFSFSHAEDADTLYICVISGKPECIKNLDEGMFVSAAGTPKTKKHVYVMSEARFKLFEPKKI